MTKYRYSPSARAHLSRSFGEASREELRVLVAVMESAEPLSVEQISSLASVSPARARGAVAFWSDEGIFTEGDGIEITEEFVPTVRRGEIDEIPAARVALSIRDEGLAELIEECAEIMGKPALMTEEIKNLTALVTQYALTTDYIATLAAYLASKGKLTAVRLRDRAIALVGRGVDTTEALEVYIKNKEKQSSAEIEFRRLLGIYNRSTTEIERNAFNKWSEEFGYSTAIVGEAYNVCVANTGSLSVPYMDKVLTAWHEAGCKTAEECKAFYASQRASEKPEGKSAAGERPKHRSKSEPEKPRYGDFDVNDAFAAALKRSYE